MNNNLPILQIKVKYHDSNMPRLEINPKGDWIDLRVVDIANRPRSLTKNNVGEEGWFLATGEFLILDLGVSIELPEGFEAVIVPRSSTFKRWGFIQTNYWAGDYGGIIDNSYKGDNDKWLMPILCFRSTFLPKYARVCQFKIQRTMRSQWNIKLVEVEKLNNPDRNGLGSTGVK